MKISLISVVQFTFQTVYLYRIHSEFSYPLFQFLRFKATFCNFFLLTRYVLFCLIIADLYTVHSPINLQKPPSQNALTQLLPSFFDSGRSYSNRQLPSFLQPKMASRIFLFLSFISLLVLSSLYTDFPHFFPHFSSTLHLLLAKYGSSKIYITMVCIVYINCLTSPTLTCFLGYSGQGIISRPIFVFQNYTPVKILIDPQAKLVAFSTWTSVDKYVSSIRTERESFPFPTLQ